MASYKHHLSLQSHMRTAHQIFDPNSPIERRSHKPGPIIRPPRSMDEMNATPNDENGLIMDIKAEPQDEVANGEEQAYNCADCEQTFQDVVEYNQHLAEHKREAGVPDDGDDEANDGGDESGGGSSTSGSQKNKCNQCSAGPFRTPSGLYHHMQTTHNLLRFKCTYCMKQFTRKQTLNDHNCKVKQLAQHPIMTAVHNSTMMSSAAATAAAAAAAQGTGTLNCPYCDYETDMREK
jgi:transposase-like protein